MTKIAISLFYAFLAYVIFHNGHIFFKLSPELAEFVLFAKPVSFFLHSKLSYPILYTIGISSVLICIIKPDIKYRVLASLFFLIFMSILFSYGKIHHSEHIWMFSSVIFCFIAHQEPLSSLRNILVIRLTQTILLSFYFISGLWKLRELGFSNWREAALEHISHAIAEGNGPGEQLQQLLLQDHVWLVTAGFSLVILFQLSAVFPVFTMKHFKVWGIGAVFFHLSTGVALGIWFSSMALAALLILVIFEILLETV